MRIPIVLILSLAIGSTPISAAEVSRRSFFNMATAAALYGAAMGSGSLAAKIVDSMTTSKQVSVEEGGRIYSYSQTALEQHLVLIGRLITTRLVKATFGGRYGNAGITDETLNEMLKNPVSLWANMAVIAPGDRGDFVPLAAWSFIWNQLVGGDCERLHFR